MRLPRDKVVPNMAEDGIFKNGWAQKGSMHRMRFQRTGVFHGEEGRCFRKLATFRGRELFVERRWDRVRGKFAREAPARREYVDMPLKVEKYDPLTQERLRELHHATNEVFRTEHATKIDAYNVRLREIAKRIRNIIEMDYAAGLGTRLFVTGFFGLPTVAMGATTLRIWSYSFSPNRIWDEASFIKDMAMAGGALAASGMTLFFTALTAVSLVSVFDWVRNCGSYRAYARTARERNVATRQAIGASVSKVTELEATSA